MSEEKARPKEFEPITEPGEINRYLREGARNASAAMIWTKNQEHVLNANISVFNEKDKAFFVTAPKGFDPRAFMDDLAKRGLSECFFSASLPSANLFFKSKFVSADATVLRFSTPEQVFKVQRRKDLRISIRDGYILKVEFQDPLLPDNIMTKKAIDISASGMAILVSADEKPLFQSGVILTGLKFVVRGKTIVCDAEVRHARETSPESKHSGVKVGLLFVKIKAGDSQHIASYVFEESRKFYSRFL